MDIMKITDLTNLLGISSRSLRYYEQVGLIKSVRPEFEKYRFYDAENIERLKQIMVLRKMQIPIKDIMRIYESQDMSVVVESFVQRINAIEEEIGALSELKRVVDDFLQIMLKNGVTKISALPLLYEEMDKQLVIIEEQKFEKNPRFFSNQPLTYERLLTVNDKLDKLNKPLNVNIIELPQMRVLSSKLKDSDISDTEGFWDWINKNNIPFGKAGQHSLFEYQDNNSQTIIIQKVDDNFNNNSPYSDYMFSGGLYAVANTYLDEELSERFHALIKEFDDNKYYQIDYRSDCNTAMLENLISPDDQRELVALLVPIKKRIANPVLFDKPEEINDISIAEIEVENPVLWEVEVALDKMLQTHPQNSYFNINENGEAEYIGWILRAVLNTNVSVKLPFRIDMEFRQSGECKTGIVFYHSEDTGYSSGLIGSRGFGINMSNDNEQMLQAIRFHQPIFWDDYHFPKRGIIKENESNHISWIIGKKHLAVIINGEIRYCGVNFPYMSLDLSRETAQPIVIGTHGNEKIYFRKIRVSQLKHTPKIKIKEGTLTMVTKQSNNIIPIIHRLVTDEYGENYWFNGCAKYVMECLGEKDYDYWFFAGLTGDLFTQHYSYTNFSGDAATSYLMEENPVQFIEDTFLKCGYSATYVSSVELSKNTEMYLNTLIAYIDKGIPVISWGSHFGVYVGYEEYGKVLLLITGNNNQPERIPLDKVFETNTFHGYKYKSGWIFVGDKKENYPLAKIYRKAIKDILPMQNVKTDTYCFGPEAFRAWVHDIENGKFNKMTVEEFDTWCDYTDYICVLATNGSCCHEFLKRAQELNPDMTYLQEISSIYKRTADLWNNDGGKDLEALGGGFNITLETLQNKEKCVKIVAKIREIAVCMDRVVEILQSNLSK